VLHTGAIVFNGAFNARVAARYQRVSEVPLMRDFSRSVAGKVLKREMREPYWRQAKRRI
jgi:hypothetical protein